MKITIALRGTLRKYFAEGPERSVVVPDNCTCEEALAAAGLNWREIKNFGFVAINSKRVMITDRLTEGDQLKAFSKVSGG